MHAGQTFCQLGYLHSLFLFEIFRQSQRQARKTRKLKGTREGEGAPHSGIWLKRFYLGSKTSNPIGICCKCCRQKYHSVRVWIHSNTVTMALVQGLGVYVTRNGAPFLPWTLWENLKKTVSFAQSRCLAFLWSKPYLSIGSTTSLGRKQLQHNSLCDYCKGSASDSLLENPTALPVLVRLNFLSSSFPEP